MKLIHTNSELYVYIQTMKDALVMEGTDYFCDVKNKSTFSLWLCFASVVARYWMVLEP